MVQVFRIPISKEKLKALSADERVLLLLLGYVSNQLMMMQKLLMFSANHEDSDEPAIQYPQSIQTQMILRLMIGLLHEAWDVIVTRFNKNAFNVEYRKLLDEAGLTALAELNRQFGSSNLLTKIRNAFAFHHPNSAEAESAFAAALINKDFADEDWALFFSQSGLNSLFFVSDVVVLHGIMGVMGEKDWGVGQTKMVTEVKSATHNIVEFAKSFTVAVWRKHFGEEMTSDKIIEIQGAPDVDSVKLPFYISIPGEKPIEKNAVFTVRPRNVDL